MRINPIPEQKKIVTTMRKTQKDWIAYFNEKKMKMVSVPDIYKAANDKKVIESLRKDFQEHWLVTSSRMNTR